MLRKDGQTPYIVHPQEVARILKKYTADEDTICAGWLHDTIEDVSGYTYEILEKDFGPKVKKIVEQVSEKKDPLDTREKSIATWRQRKEDYIENLHHDDPEALMVCCADKIANLSSLIAFFQREGDTTWKHFNAPAPVAQSEMWYYSEVLKVLQSRLQNGIVSEYADVVTEAEKTFK